MPLGQVLYESGSTLAHVYFPTTAIVSLLYVMENGASAEIAVVGHEGVVGISLFMGGESTPSRAVVQSAGQGFRLKAETIKEEFKRAPVLHLLLRYTQALITQMAQTACRLAPHTPGRCRQVLLAAREAGPLCRSSAWHCCPLFSGLYTHGVDVAMALSAGGAGGSGDRGAGRKTRKRSGRLAAVPASQGSFQPTPLT